MLFIGNLDLMLDKDCFDIKINFLTLLYFLKKQEKNSIKRRLNFLLAPSFNEKYFDETSYRLYL